MSFLLAMLMTTQVHAAEIQVVCATDGDRYILANEPIVCTDNTGRRFPGGVVPANAELRLTDFHISCVGTATSVPMALGFLTDTGLEAYVLTLPWSSGFVSISPKTAPVVPAGGSLQIRTKHGTDDAVCDVEIIAVLSI